MTIEQFCRLPEAGPFYYELRHGELVRVTRPKFKHVRIQRQLRKLLESFAGESGVVDTEVAFRALPEHELRVADVSYISRERWERIDPEDWLALRTWSSRFFHPRIPRLRSTTRKSSASSTAAGSSGQWIPIYAK